MMYCIESARLVSHQQHYVLAIIIFRRFPEPRFFISKKKIRDKRY